MARRFVLFATFCLLPCLLAGPAAAGNGDNPLTGTWDCRSKGGPDGELAFKLNLQQNGENVDGSLMSSIGDAPLSYGSFKGNTLEVHIEMPDGTYILTASLTRRTLAGELSYRKIKGTWEGTKTWPAEK